MSADLSGDITAIATAVLALFAIVTAWYARRAFLKQSDAVRDGRELIGQQKDMLQVQSDRLEVYRKQVDEQRQINAAHGEVLELQAAEIRESLTVFSTETVMPEDAAHDDVTAATPALRTLAAKVDWLISTARPAGRGPYSNAEVAALIRKATGEPVTGTAVSKLRSGQAANPHQRLIGAMAQFFGVPPDFFFDGYDGDQAMSLTRDQAEMLALIRASGITPAELRVLLGLSPQAGQLLVDFVTAAARDQARHPDGPGEPAP